MWLAGHHGPLHLVAMHSSHVASGGVAQWGKLICTEIARGQWGEVESSKWKVFLGQTWNWQLQLPHILMG